MYTSLMKTDSAQSTLRNASLRATVPRIAVLNRLQAADLPVSVDDLYRTLRAKKIDRVTIYRTLQSFAEAHLVRAVDLKRGHMLYELHDEHDHHHLVCVSCGLTEDFTGCNFDELSSQALKKSRSFTSVSEHSLELFGTCTSCTK